MCLSKATKHGPEIHCDCVIIPPYSAKLQCLIKCTKGLCSSQQCIAQSTSTCTKFFFFYCTQYISTIPYNPYVSMALPGPPPTNSNERTKRTSRQVDIDSIGNLEVESGTGNAKIKSRGNYTYVIKYQETHGNDRGSGRGRYKRMKRTHTTKDQRGWNGFSTTVVRARVKWRVEGE